MIQSEHFGKQQSQMLIAVVWFHNPSSTTLNRNIKRIYFVFTSSYLTHSSIFFQKCYNIFKEKITPLIHWNINTEIILSDGSSQQFKNKNNFYWTSLQAYERGTSFFL